MGMRHVDKRVRVAGKIINVFPENAIRLKKTKTPLAGDMRHTEPFKCSACFSPIINHHISPIRIRLIYLSQNAWCSVARIIGRNRKSIEAKRERRLQC